MKPQQPEIEHTAQFSRRNLFPSEDNTGSDLGLISPLNFDSDTELPPLNDKCVGDYDILGPLEKNTSIHTPNNTQCFPESTKIFTPSTIDESPTQKLKTPHDTCDNSKFPKLVRKTQVDTGLQDSCINPKVRTALFPEIDMSLPSRTFYPKSQSEVSPKSALAKNILSPKRNRKKQGLYLCGRKNFRSGQINAGVRHKIKKPKRKKLSKLAVLQAAINIIENSPLNSFFEDSLETQLVPQKPNLPPIPPQPRDPTPSPEPDPNKKFFKSSRQKGVVNIISNIKIEMNHGKMNLLPGNASKTASKRRHTHEQNKENNCKKIKLAEEFENEQISEEPLIGNEQISSIINALEEEKKENEVKLSIIDPIALMSPTSQMCNMTSGLALNSPKKARDLSSVLEAMPSNNFNNNKNTQEKKLFPVFYPGKTVFPGRTESMKSMSCKKFRGLSKDQMLLDAGQKRFGATQCPECKTIYHMGDPGDEIMHLNYHNAGHIFRFNGWKNERVVSNDFRSGKIIQIAPGDPKIWWKKIKEVMDVINRDLGYYDIEFNTSNSQIFFYIQNKVIVGVLVAELKHSAHKLLTTPEDQVDLCSEEAYPIKCGVSRIWVAQNQRKKGIATALMNALKRNFIFGHILNNDDIAFSSPTEMGKIFGQKYFKTPNFLIYFV